MKLRYIVEITTRDEKTKKHVCNDFPAINPDFVTLYKKDFRRERIRMDTILSINEYWEYGKTQGKRSK